MRSSSPNAFRLAVILVMVMMLPSLIVLGAEPVTNRDGNHEKAAKKLDTEKSDSSTPLKDWLTFFGTITAALIAGLFAVYQLHRSTAAQRALEREKLVTTRTEAELAQVRSSTRDYRQAQALPFLEQLD